MTVTSKDTDKKTMGAQFKNGFQEMVAPLVKKYPEFKFLDTPSGEYGTFSYISCYCFICIILTAIFFKKIFKKKSTPNYYY